MLQWLQRNHACGYFSRLQCLSLSAWAADCVDNVDNLQIAAAAVGMLMLCGFWPLVSCRVNCLFDLGQVSKLLPITIQHLHISVHLELAGGCSLNLSDFQHFTDLRYLHLDRHDRLAIGKCKVYLGNSKPFQRLESLQLAEFLFDDQGQDNAGHLFPKLRHAALTVTCASTQKSIMRWPCIEYLELGAGSNHVRNTSSLFKFAEAGCLCWLLVLNSQEVHPVWFEPVRGVLGQRDKDGDAFEVCRVWHSYGEQSAAGRVRSLFLPLHLRRLDIM